MGVKDWVVGQAVSLKLSSYTSNHPVPRDVPAADVKKLEQIAAQIAAKAPGLAAGLAKALPPSLPPESTLTPEMKTAAQKLGDHLLKLVPAHLTSDVDKARETATHRGYDYGTVVAKYDRLLTALPATKHFADDLAPALVAFAASHGITPAELAKFQQSLLQIEQMIPLVNAAGADPAKKLTRLADLVGLAKLGD